ncbi:MAG: hypothetical protein ACNA8W_04985, partial [Bradymonadaceae bacterium]
MIVFDHKRVKVLVLLGAFGVLWGCERTEPESVEPESAFAAPESLHGTETEPPVQGRAWVELPSVRDDILGIRKLMGAFSETSRCFSHEGRDFICLGTRHYERRNSRGEAIPYSQDVPGFLVGREHTLHYVMVERMGIDGSTRRLTFAETGYGESSGPALILEGKDEIPEQAIIQCGEQTFVFEPLSPDDSREVLSKRTIQIPPPPTEVSGGRLEDGTLIVLWTGSMPGLPQQRILAMGAPPTLEILEIVRSQTSPTDGSRLFELPNGGSLFIASAGSQSSYFQSYEESEKQTL